MAAAVAAEEQARIAAFYARFAKAEEEKKLAEEAEAAKRAADEKAAAEAAALDKVHAARSLSLVFHVPLARALLQTRPSVASCPCRCGSTSALGYMFVYFLKFT